MALRSLCILSVVSIDSVKGALQMQKQNDKMISMANAMALIVAILFY